ncbi:MAG: polysaccharide biosynthesis C-terminal domain-containing protein, partial [Candidatus Jordarchaeaceae archaeon]
FLRNGGIVANPNRVVGEILKAKLFIFIVWAPIVVLIYAIQNKFISSAFLFVCALDIWSDSNLFTIIYGFNVQRNYSAITKVIFLSRLGRLVGALVLVLYGIRVPEVFALIRLLFTVLGLITALYIYRPFIEGGVLQMTVIPLKELMPFVLSEMLVQIYVVADVSLLSILSNPTQVGLYSPASSLISALFIIPNTIYLFLVPVYSKIIARHQYLTKKHVYLPLGGMAVLGILLSVSLGGGGHWFVPVILCDAFKRTSDLLMLLSPILFFKCLQFGLAAIIVAAGWQTYRLIPQFVSSLVNVLVNVILIPNLGAQGAVIAYNASELILLLGYTIIVASKTLLSSNKYKL